MPMLDEAEFKACFSDGGPFADAITGKTTSPVLAKQRWHLRVLERYRSITGFNETNINAVYHHRLSLYGKPCPACGKPFRTPQAKYCASCGFKLMGVSGI
jgi:hypothetical protein